jgi:hypothetical protein
MIDPDHDPLTLPLSVLTTRLAALRDALAKERAEIEALQRYAASSFVGIFRVDDPGLALEKAARRDGYAYRPKQQRVDDLTAVIAGMEQLSIVAEYRESRELLTDATRGEEARRRCAQLKREHHDLLVATGALS